MRCALYHRVSTLDQDATAAREDLRAAVRRLGGEETLSVEETGSGARNDRPGLQRMLEAARRGRIDAVFVWKLDRFGRSALDVLANIQALADSGVRFVAVTQGLDVKPGGDAASRLLLGVLAAVAEFERDLIRERTRAGIERARRAGRHLGHPFGPNRPSRVEVERLRGRGLSWSEASRELGCTVGSARRASVR